MARRRSPRAALVFAVLAVVLIGVGAYIVSRVVACTELVMWTSDEKYDEVRHLAEDFKNSRQRVDGHCVSVVAEISSSRSTADLLATDPSTPWPSDRTRPDLWSPSSSVWMQRLRDAIAVKPGYVASVPDTPSLAITPVIIAMPQPMAEALGWPNATIGWTDLIALAGGTGWASKGHPEWGRFTLGKTNPAESTTGLLSTIATVTALSGTDGELGPTDLPKAATNMATIESATVHYGRYMETFVNNLYQADTDGAGLEYVSAIAMEEKVLLDYNKGILVGNPTHVDPPKQRLAAIFPADGTMFSDNPVLVPDAAWVTPPRRRAAEAFVAYALSHPQAFLDAGFRDREGQGGPAHTIAAGTVPAPSFRLVRTPPTAVIDGVRELWRQTRRLANVLMVLDVSNSMNTTVAAAGKSRLELAQAAASVVPDQLSATDKIACWEFSSPVSTDVNPWRELVQLGSVSTNTDAYAAKVKALRPLGQTALYATTRGAVGYMKAHYDSSRINAIVLLSDGRNEYPADDDLAKLLRDLRASTSDSPVRVFSIAYGSDADTEALDQISRATRAKMYEAHDPTQVNDVMLDVLSNF